MTKRQKSKKWKMQVRGKGWYGGEHHADWSPWADVAPGGRVLVVSLGGERGHVQVRLVRR